MQEFTTVQMFVIWFLPILFALTVHEVSHGYVAYLLGDKTAQMLGRLTLNPLKHIDILGTIIVPLVLMLTSGMMIGWAKPVPITSRNLAKPRRDLACIAAAGPLANLLMAFAWGGIIKLTQDFPTLIALQYMGMAGIKINITWMVLNLLPLPPLDGSRVVESFLPNNIGVWYSRIAPYGIWILMFLMMTGFLWRVMSPPIQFFVQQIYMLYNF